MGCAAHIYVYCRYRESLNVEGEERLLCAPLTCCALLCSGLAATQVSRTRRTRRRGRARRDLRRPASLTSPFLSLVRVCVRTSSQQSLCSHLTEEMNQKLIYSPAAHLFISQAVTTAHLCSDQQLKSCPSQASIALKPRRVHTTTSRGPRTETDATHIQYA